MDETSVEIESLEPPVVGNGPMLPFAFALSHFVGEACTFERTCMIDDTRLTVLAVVELEGGQVAT